MDKQYIIAHADKSILKISGLTARGLNTRQLEEKLMERLNTLVRVIGVTGDKIDMDVYDAEPEQIRQNAGQVLEALSLTEGITASELVQISLSEKIIEVDFREIKDRSGVGCARERWLSF